MSLQRRSADSLFLFSPAAFSSSFSVDYDDNGSKRVFSPREETMTHKMIKKKKLAQRRESNHKQVEMDLELKKHNPDKVCRYQPEQSEETVLLKQHSWMFMSFLFVSFNPRTNDYLSNVQYRHTSTSAVQT